MILHQPSTEEGTTSSINFQSTPIADNDILGGGGGGGGGRGGGGGGRFSVGSDVHTTDFSSFLYHLLSKAHFCMLMDCCILHFEKAENFVIYNVILFHTAPCFYSFATNF